MFFQVRRLNQVGRQANWLIGNTARALGPVFTLGFSGHSSALQVKLQVNLIIPLNTSLFKEELAQV